MNYTRGFADLKEQRQLHYEPACQKDTKTAIYKYRQIPQFKVSLGQSEFRSKHSGNANLRARSYLASLLSVLTKIPEFKVSMGQSKFRSRCGRNSNLRMGSHPAKLIICV